MINTLKRAGSRIYRALLKHGYSEFRLEKLEYCKSAITIKREGYYLDNLKHEYNILKTAGATGVGYRHSSGSIEKMRESQSKRFPKLALKGIGTEVKDKNTGKEIIYLRSSTISAAAEFLGVRPSTLDYRKRRGINTPIEAKAKGIKGKLYLIVYNSAKVKKMSKERKKVMSSIVVGLKDLLLAKHADRVNSPIRFYGRCC